MKRKIQNIVFVQYLGYRFHGWAKQPDVKTVQGEIEKNIRFVLPEENFTTLGSSRTDSMVSANQNAFSIYTFNELPSDFLEQVNNALPNDIRLLEIKKAPPKFNIIHHVSQKEYLYNFSTDASFHPFETPLITFIKESLDIELMQKGALLFEGEHYFKNYCYKPKEEQEFNRSILSCQIIKTDSSYISRNISDCYTLKVIGKGFLRYQIRFIMGALINLGLGQISLGDIEQSLLDNGQSFTSGFIAPASGLVLNKLIFE